jgi:enoyl-CoA hydratase
LTTPGATFETIAYGADGPIATITLDRPDALNTIVPPMLDELEAAVGLAVRDQAVKVIVLRGAGRSFCGGFDFGGGFHRWDDKLATDGRWDPGREIVTTLSQQLGWVPKLNSLWDSIKPVIAMVHGWCVGGGSEMALSADIVLMSEDARIGTPYSRMWGCHHAGTWVYRLGLARAKELALTGRPLSGVEAAEIGLVNAAHPFERLEAEAYALAERLCSIPMSQLTAMKAIVNQAYETMGLRSTQHLGSLLDGMLRNTPEALRFIELAEAEGVPAAVAERDDPFGDYSRGPREGRPDPAHSYPAPARRACRR